VQIIHRNFESKPEKLVGKKLRRSDGKARGAHASPQNALQP
jgi:hypothetical protein